MTDTHPTRHYLLHLGGREIPSDPPLAASFGSYLIQVSDGSNVLIDTGFPLEWSPSERFPTLTFEHNIVSALANRDFSPVLSTS